MKSKILFILILFCTSSFTGLAQPGAQMVININPSTSTGAHTLFVYNDSLWFVDHNGIAGNEFWVSDGTQQGSRLFFDLRPGGGGSDPYNTHIFNNKLIFVASDLAGHDFLYSMDGTDSTITKIEGYFNSSGSAPDEWIIFNDRMIFVWDSAAVGEELWISDGTPEGTHLLKDIRPGTGDSEPTEFVIYNNHLYFSADDGTGREIWKTDGTPSGTIKVADINTTGTSKPSCLTNFNGMLYFAAGDGTNEYALYKTDGTNTEKIAVPDTSDTWGETGIKYLVVFNGYLFFQAYDVINKFELWRSDGTTAGTALFADIDTTYEMVNPGGYPAELTVVGNKLFFRAKKNNSGAELWVSDGTISGTKPVKDINPAGQSIPSDFFEYGGYAFFSADDGTNGVELWASDGTATNTFMVENLNGTGDGYWGEHIQYHGDLYFTGVDSANGVSIYKLINFNTAGNQELNYDNETVIKCFPNPCEEYFSLEWNVVKKSRQVISLYDVYGREINRLLDEEKPSGIYSMKCSSVHLPAGIYFITFISSQGKPSLKMIKQ